MKKLGFLLGLFAMIALFTGCKKDTIVNVTINPSSVDATPGQTVNFTIYLTPDAVNGGELGSVTVTAPDSTQQTFDKSGTSSDSISYSYTVPNDATVGSTLEITVAATDGKSGMVTTVYATINVVQGEKMVELDNITVSYNSTDLDVDNTSLLAFDGDTLTANHASLDHGDLAFTYHYDSNADYDYRHMLVSADAPALVDLYAVNNVTYDNTNKNTTKIEAYAGGKSFADITLDDLENLSVTGSTFDYNSKTSNGVTNINDNIPGMYAFELSDGRKGIIEITDYVYNTKDAKIVNTYTFNVKFVVK